MRYLQGFTANIVRRYLPKVGAPSWQWYEGIRLP